MLLNDAKRLMVLKGQLDLLQPMVKKCQEGRGIGITEVSLHFSLTKDEVEVSRFFTADEIRAHLNQWIEAEINAKMFAVTQELIKMGAMDIHGKWL